MGKISFDYDTWSDTTDRLLNRPGNSLGYTAIKTSLEVGDAESIRKRKSDNLIRNTEQGVVELIAGGLEWLRKRGYSAEDVQNKVKVFKNGNRDAGNEALLSTKVVLDAKEQISNPLTLKIPETVVIP